MSDVGAEGKGGVSEREGEWDMWEVGVLGVTAADLPRECWGKLTEAAGRVTPI